MRIFKVTANRVLGPIYKYGYRVYDCTTKVRGPAGRAHAGCRYAATKPDLWGWPSKKGTGIGGVHAAVTGSSIWGQARKAGVGDAWGAVILQQLPIHLSCFPFPCLRPPFAPLCLTLCSASAPLCSASPPSVLSLPALSQPLSALLHPLLPCLNPLAGGALAAQG